MTSAPPLIDIMSGRQVRPRKARVPRPKESKLHEEVAVLLDNHLLPDWKWRWVPMAARDARQGAMWKRKGSKPNWPDIELLSPDGSVRFLELKRLGEDLNEGQKEFRIHCINHGIPHVTAWTIGQALIALDSWGCLRVMMTGSST